MSLLCSHHKFLQPSSSQLIRLGLVGGLMMSRDHSDDGAAVETAPARYLRSRRAQFKIVILFSNHQPSTTLTCHRAPPVLYDLRHVTC